MCHLFVSGSWLTWKLLLQIASGERHSGWDSGFGWHVFEHSNDLFASGKWDINNPWHMAQSWLFWFSCVDMTRSAGRGQGIGETKQLWHSHCDHDGYMDYAATWFLLIVLKRVWRIKKKWNCVSSWDCKWTIRKPGRKDGSISYNPRADDNVGQTQFQTLSTIATFSGDTAPVIP
jgi:hypothetical protein